MHDQVHSTAAGAHLTLAEIKLFKEETLVEL